MDSEGTADLAAIAGLSSLEDPVRRRLYDYVAASDEPVSREQAASAVDIARTLAAYHLDKLVDAKLLVASYQRPPGWGGPGAGRPAKLYTRAEQELALSVPPRDYELLVRLLVSAVQHDTGGGVRLAVEEAAHDAGRREGARPGANLLASLRGCGYQPRRDERGCIVLRNCPFHSLARDYLDVVCGLNLHLVEGVIAGGGQEQARAELDPSAGRCCVVVHEVAEDTT